MVMMKIGLKKIFKSTPPYFFPLFSTGQPVRVICSVASAVESILVPRILFNVRGCPYV